ncbi:unnamed protein product [Adineta steineri]|uniref:Uncharacterized protein n=1 Tax=Adineta steineri TaxID=433720 RepID=A0A818Z9H4_9BILA|nr:unnamed protein product [Adineta steineri]
MEKQNRIRPQPVNSDTGETQFVQSTRSCVCIRTIIAIPTAIILTKKGNVVETNLTTTMMTTGEGSTTLMLATTKSSTTTPVSGSTTTKNPSTTTITTTKEAVLQTFQRTNETVYAIWNTTAGNDSSPSSPGQKPGTYYPGEPPEAALDGNLSSEYTNHGICSASDPLKNECGIQTGFYVTFNSTPFILVKFRIATNKHSPERDPNTTTIEGSNNNESDLVFGNSWTLIYNGAAGLAKDPGRRAYGNEQTILTDPSPFASYRIITTLKKGKQNCVSYSEFEMMGRFPD